MFSKGVLARGGDSSIGSWGVEDKGLQGAGKALTHERFLQIALMVRWRGAANHLTRAGD